MVPDSLPPRIGEKYLPLRVIGSGGMGTVYEVEHAGTGERLALKVLRGQAADLEPSTLERFLREARVAAWVKSEHIVRVIDVGTAGELGGIPFLVMDLLDGANLADAAGDEPQEPTDVVNWLSQVARGLDKAHAHGVVHRDLKPENLFLMQRPDAEPIVKILDFGVAKVRMGEDASRTASGEVLGTPLYMAPEQAIGDNDKIGPATDMWSLGLLAFRLLFGRDYWKAVNRNLLMIDILQKPIKRPSERGLKLGPAFDSWFLRSCDRDPRRRWPSVRLQITALAEALDVKLDVRQSNPDPAFAATLPHAVARSLKSEPNKARRFGSVFAIALGGAAAAALWLRHTQPTQGTPLPKPTVAALHANAAPQPSELVPTAASNPAAAATTPAAPSATTRRAPEQAPSTPTVHQKVQVRPLLAAASTQAKRDPLADPK